MAWIRTIPPGDAVDELRKVYTEIDARGKIAGIYRIQSLNPEALAAHNRLYMSLMFRPSPLSRAEREMAATVVSVENGCHY